MGISGVEIETLEGLLTFFGNSKGSQADGGAFQKGRELGVPRFPFRSKYFAHIFHGNGIFKCIVSKLRIYYY